MPSSLLIYLCTWITACVAALIFIARDPSAYALTRRTYRGFLFAPWKVVTFLLAGGLVTFIAPYTDDPTWDRCNGFFMSALAYLTAPWVVGVLYRTARGMLPVRQVFPAVCIWLFSVSWSYDLYLFIRDGLYPETWLPNLFASSFLYLLAGLFWNLDWKEGRGVLFGFTEQQWPQKAAAGVAAKIFWYALPFMVIVAVLILKFLFPMR